MLSVDGANSMRRRLAALKFRLQNDRVEFSNLGLGKSGLAVGAERGSAGVFVVRYRSSLCVLAEFGTWWD